MDKSFFTKIIELTVYKIIEPINKTIIPTIAPTLFINKSLALNKLKKVKYLTTSAFPPTFASIYIKAGSPAPKPILYFVT